jgi:N-methylhydantoinase B/oxoprolinase/acetone carboxylase alpha subunit
VTLRIECPGFHFGLDRRDASQGMCGGERCLRAVRAVYLRGNHSSRAGRKQQTREAVWDVRLVLTVRSGGGRDQRFRRERPIERGTANERNNWLAPRCAASGPRASMCHSGPARSLIIDWTAGE